MARDPIGIIPLYYGHDANGQLFVASEMKALMEVCNQVHEFPPGHYWVSGQDEPQRWYHRDWERLKRSRTPSPTGPACARRWNRRWSAT